TMTRRASALGRVRISISLGEPERVTQGEHFPLSAEPGTSPEAPRGAQEERQKKDVPRARGERRLHPVEAPSGLERGREDATSVPAGHVLLCERLATAGVRDPGK